METDQIKIIAIKVFFGDFESIKGQKIGIEGSSEKEQRVVYDIIIDEGVVVPAIPGKYPIEYFEDLPRVAAFVSRNEPTPIVKAKEVLLYIGESTD